MLQTGRRWRGLLAAVPEQLRVLVSIQVRDVQLKRRTGCAEKDRGLVASNADALVGHKTEKSLLVISYYSPPYKSHFGTQRLHKFIKYLSRFGWRIVLITTAPSSDADTDGSVEPFADTVSVIRLPRRDYRVAGARGLLVPDHYVGWIRPALKSAHQAIGTHRPTAIFASVPPYSNALAAALLSMETGIPLITDFRDPWTKIDLVWVIRNPVLRWLSGKLELMVLRRSASVVMAHELMYAREFFVRCDDGIQSKIVSILNGYDEEEFSMAKIDPTYAKKRKFIVSYAGSFYDLTTFANVKYAFEQWNSHYPEELEDVEFHYAGPNSDYFDLHHFRPHYLHDHGYVSHHEAIRIRAESCLQLFTQPPSFKAHVIGAKIYEMMRLPAPILAITNRSGSAARFVEQTGTGIVADNEDLDSAARALRDFYLAWKSGNTIVQRNDSAIAAFSREKQAEELAKVITNVANG
jgi:glycosyltransferase involved in cell wall biosynthesis